MFFFSFIRGDNNNNTVACRLFISCLIAVYVWGLCIYKCVCMCVCMFSCVSEAQNVYFIINHHYAWRAEDEDEKQKKNNMMAAT